MVIQIAKQLKLRQTVIATALLYFRRFYLKYMTTPHSCERVLTQCV